MRLVANTWQHGDTRSERMCVKLKRQHLLVAVCLSLLLVVPHATAEVIELDGTIRSIDQDTRAISITRKTPKGEKVLELEVAKNAGDIGSFKEGDPVTFAYNPDVDIISKIEKGVSEEAAAALKNLQGEWLAFTEETGGKRVSKDEMKKKRKVLRVTGDRITLSTSYYRLTGRITPVESDGPAAFDINGRVQYGEENDGVFVGKKPEVDVVMKTIAEVSGATLRLCYSLSMDGSNKPRPTEYETDEGHPGLSVAFRKLAEKQ
jgi:uncharacterized protein (TIGR03067 family)